MFFTDALVQLASNTKTTLNASGWPAAAAFMFGTAVVGGVASYGIHKHYEYKKMTAGLEDMECFRIEGPGK